MSWLEKLLPSKTTKTAADAAATEYRSAMPEGLWIKCPSCESVLYRTDLEQNQNVCPQCSHHHRIGARARLDAFLDAEGRYELGQEVLPMDALKFNVTWSADHINGDGQPKTWVDVATTNPAAPKKED